MNQVSRFLTKLYRGVGSARAKRLECLLSRGEWGLIQKETLSHPSTYQNATVYFKDALVVEVTRKLLLPGDTRARRKAAERTFWDAESQCAATNARLSRFVNLQGPFEPQDEPLISFISSWRERIAEVLGYPPAVLTPRFSPGATLSDSGKRTTIPDKLSSEPTRYAGSDPFFNVHLNGTPFFLKPYGLRRGNRFFTVPKDSSKDRGCCVEANLNVFLQLDAGEHIKRRIEKAYKVDMGRREAIHHDRARRGSEDGTFATIDLSNASDTVAAKLVELLLPPRWYCMLNSLRAKTTKISGKNVYLNKFSSMGNGFTFPLETLLYWTLADTIGDRDACVYGDDIIVHKQYSAAMVGALKFFGFTPNSKKTFCEGPFRESCGGDFFQGVPVRAYYLEELPTEPQHWVGIANGLRRADPELRYVRAAWHFCIDQLPTDWRNFTAEEFLGEGTMAVYLPTAQPETRFFPWPERIKCFGRLVGDYLPAWKVKVPVTSKFELTKHFPFEVAFTAASMGVGTHLAPRGAVAGYKTHWIAATPGREF